MASDPEKAEAAVARGDEDDVEEEEADGMDELGNAALAIEDLPPEVQRRIKALRKSQLEIIKVEAQFYKEMHALECKFLPLYQPFFDLRDKIVAGGYEPTEEECDLSELGLKEEELASSVDKLAIDEKKEKVPGIPEFWAQIFRNVELLSDMVKEYDLPIIKHLSDIKVEMTSEPMGFKLHFHFTPNEFFTNSVLTKTYLMKSELDSEDPFSFEGPEIVKCTGCTIDWVKGKNVTVKIIRKKQKHKQRGSIRTVSKTIEVPSFFNFFTPPEISDDPNEVMDEETQMKLTSDFEVGQYIRERIVPRAILYYTGEALEDEEDDFDEEEEEEEEEDDEDDEDAAPGRKKTNRKRDMPAKQPECKQQ